MTDSGTVRRKPRHLEAIEQRLFVQRFRLDPRTRDLPACAIPNGGRRGPREAALLKAEGVTAGAPDWVLFVPRSGWAGLALEFKSPTGKGRLTVTQSDFHESLRAHGWMVAVVTSALAAWDILMAYMGAQV
jgi:hypothetical protein